MAVLAKGRLSTQIPVLEQALTGLMRDHHRRLLTLQLADVDFWMNSLTPCVPRSPACRAT
jgi:hypothetical protein